MVSTSQMLRNLLLLLAVLVSIINCEDSFEEEDQENRLEDLCNRDIPEERSVEVGGECRTSLNCQQEDAECVNLRENYCECQVTEDRMNRMSNRGGKKKWKKKFQRRQKKDCKKNEGFSCIPSSECKPKYTKKDKNCKHWRHSCCSKCKGLKMHKCVPTNACPNNARKKWFQCNNKNSICCNKEPCGGPCKPDEVCDKKSNKCICKPGTVYIKEKKMCLPTAKNGEPCMVDGQCIVPMQMCNMTAGTCECVTGSLYNATSDMCGLECWTTYTKSASSGRLYYSYGTDDEYEFEVAKSMCESSGGYIPALITYQDEVDYINYKKEISYADEDNWMGLVQKGPYEYTWSTVDVTFKVGNVTGDAIYGAFAHFYDVEAGDVTSYDDDDCFYDDGIDDHYSWEDTGCDNTSHVICECPSPEKYMEVFVKGNKDYLFKTGRFH